MTSAVLATALFSSLLGCGGGSDVLPEELCGRWVTGDAKYEGRYLELSNESIRFGNGDEQLSEFPVVGIHVSEREGDALYDVTYLDATDEESIFTFEHQVTRGSIRIAHSPGRRWTKWIAPEEPMLDSELETAPAPKTEKN